MSAYTHRGHVYFATCGDYVKIGYSSQAVGKRLQSLATPASRIIRPDDLDRSQPIGLLHVIPGCVIRDERRLHDLFAAHHVIGEWYRLDAAFLDHLDGLVYRTYRESLADLRRVRRELKRRPSLARAA